MPLLISPPLSFSATTTADLPIPSGGAGLGLVANIITTGVTGTWTFLLGYKAPDGTVLATHTVTGSITTNTSTNVVLAAPYGLTVATPIPNQIVATMSVGGVATVNVILAWNV